MRSNSGAERKNSALVGGAEAHDALDAGAVVPAPIEEDHLPCSRQMGHVALEVPLRLLPLRRGRQRDHPTQARADRLGDALDDATLSRRISALEDHDDLQALVPDPLLKDDELGLEPSQLRLVQLLLQPAFSIRRWYPDGRCWHEHLATAPLSASGR